MVDSPSVPHSPAWGWTRLAAGGSEVCLGDLHRTIALFPGSAATVPLYESNDVDRSQVTRVVLGVQALGADGWHYFTNLVNTRNKAWGNNAGFDKSKVSVVLPQFIRQADRDAGAATPTDLWFDPNTYGYGGSALGPATVLNGRTIGTFDVLDATIQWIEARYPKVQRIVLVGHSLGAQMIQRYGYLRRDGQPGKARIDYAIMNAGSYAYPLKYRPRSVDTCPQYDSWPFGLSSSADPSSVPPYAATAASQFGRKGLINRYATRNVHILLGSEDYASGTAKCGAIVQGKFHLSRGRFYAAAVINATGTTQAFQAAGGMNRLQSSIPRGQAGLPAPWTYDIVPGCAHSQECMYQSDAGIRRIMLDGYSASGSAAAAAVSRRSATGVGRSHLDVLVDEEED